MCPLFSHRADWGYSRPQCSPPPPPPPLLLCLHVFLCPQSDIELGFCLSLGARPEVVCFWACTLFMFACVCVCASYSCHCRLDGCFILAPVAIATQWDFCLCLKPVIQSVMAAAKGAYVQPSMWWGAWNATTTKKSKPCVFVWQNCAKSRLTSKSSKYKVTTLHFYQLKPAISHL